jgi:hypothetical protein
MKIKPCFGGRAALKIGLGGGEGSGGEWGRGGEGGRVGLVYFFHTPVFWTMGMGEKLFRGLGGEKLSSSFFYNFRGGFILHGYPYFRINHFGYLSI